MKNIHEFTGTGSMGTFEGPGPGLVAGAMGKKVKKLRKKRLKIKEMITSMADELVPSPEQDACSSV